MGEYALRICTFAQVFQRFAVAVVALVFVFSGKPNAGTEFGKRLGGFLRGEGPACQEDGCERLSNFSGSSGSGRATPRRAALPRSPEIVCTDRHVEDSGKYLADGENQE